MRLNPHRLHIHRHVLEDLRDDVIGGDAFGLGLEVEDQAVAQGGVGGGLDVLEATLKRP